MCSGMLSGIVVLITQVPLQARGGGGGGGAGGHGGLEPNQHGPQEACQLGRVRTF